MFRSLLFAVAFFAFIPGTVLAISVSGVVTTTDGSSPAGVQIRVEQVGGELPIFSTTTEASGSWSVSDPLLFGNIRITAAKAGYQLTPSTIDRFTSSTISDGNFVAAPLVPDLTVRSADGRVLEVSGVVSFGSNFPGSVRTLALTLRNDGISAMHTLSASISGPLAGEFSIVAQPPATLAPKESVVLQLAWTPAALGLRDAMLTIHSDDPDEGTFPITLTGNTLSLDLITVRNPAESGPGSLRAAVAQAAAVAGPQVVRFDPVLNGAIITLSSEIVFNDTDGVALDASNLPAGLEIAGSNRSRHFRVNAGVSVGLTNLTLTNGEASEEDRGGSIRNEGTLLAQRCRFRSNIRFGNADSAGGAIFNSGQLSLIECELSGNAAKVGGGIYNEGTADLTDCSLTRNGSFFFTLSGGAIISNGSLQLNRCLLDSNTAKTSGAGLFLLGPTTLTFCTISGNQCFDTIARGGGIMNTTGVLQLDHCTVTLNVGNGIHQEPLSGVTHLRHTIVSRNFSASRPIESNFGGVGSKFFLDAPNLLRFHSSDMIGETPITTDPQLSPLGNFGGKTLTHALLPGSPARNAATGSTATADQRSFPIVGVPDLGAYEAGTLASNYFAYIWETLPSSATPGQHDPEFDFDGDGRSNLDEWLAQTDAADVRSFFFTEIRPGNASLAIEFPSVIGRRYTLETSRSLATDSFQPSPDQPIRQGDGTLLRFNIDPTSEHQFFRVQAIP